MRREAERLQVFYRQTKESRVKEAQKLVETLT